ncbi:transferase [Fluviicola chungangensis]|uniref:Transferase n=1 Tax=Fluviicola chungangensis TaxID=2597671 RepID=A0A556N0X4_9FLAO|nr:transferase [Fluviicola chungangensis]TSJ45678.1 transferase [Fluviicola chungangensis]
MKKIGIIGAGGHAKVIAETIDLIGSFQVVGFIDDKIERGFPIHKNAPVLGAIGELNEIAAQCDAFVIGIGNNEVRKHIADRWSGTIVFETIIHPNAVISESASIGSGTVVLAGTIISSQVKIGNHCIVNANVVIDHDSRIGEFVHLSIGTLIGSNSEVGELTITGIGQAVPSFSQI